MFLAKIVMMVVVMVIEALMIAVTVAITITAIEMTLDLVVDAVAFSEWPCLGFCLLLFFFQTVARGDGGEVEIVVAVVVMCAYICLSFFCISVCECPHNYFPCALEVIKMSKIILQKCSSINLNTFKKLD